MSVREVLGAQVVNRSSLAALVFLTYDTCLTFADEVEHIWSKPHSSPTKWLFIVLRWFTLAVLVSMLFTGTELGVSLGVSSAPYCRTWYIFQSAALQLVVALMEVILAQRVYALYDQSRVVVGGLLIAFIVEQAVMATSLAITVPRVMFTDICVSLSVPPAAVWFGVAPIVYELTLLILTLARLVSHVRVLGWRRAPLHRLLVRDGLWAFLLVLVGFVLNAMLYVVVSGPQNATAWAWQYAVAAFSGCRLVLNMHTDPILAPGPALSPGLRSAGAACTGGSGESAFALTTFLPTLNTDDDNVELDDPGGSWRVETVRRSGA